MRNASYLLPTLAIAVVAWLGTPSWWAVAMLVGGAKFAWDYLWGERQVLDGAHGLRMVALGLALLAAAFALAWNLGMNLHEFQALRRGLNRHEDFLYMLPGIGIGLTLYGLLVWSRAFARER